jgi:hypothetical protein
MPPEINSTQDLLEEMAQEAARLGLKWSGNPDLLSEPVNPVDALLEYFEDRANPQHTIEITPVPHESTDLDDQPDDPEELSMAQDTLQFFMETESFDPTTFDQDLRGFLHCEDYSYSEKTIRQLVASVLG